MEQLEVLATRFRDAIERTPSYKLPITMQNFPAGACGDATLLLGHFFKAQGLGDFNYVLGYRGEGEDHHSHAWLQRDGVIIDITADQFAEIEQDVIVSTSSEWHHSFITEVPHEADFKIYDAYTATTLEAAYRTVLQHIETPAVCSDSE